MSPLDKLHAIKLGSTAANDDLDRFSGKPGHVFARLQPLNLGGSFVATYVDALVQAEALDRLTVLVEQPYLQISRGVGVDI